MLDSEIPKGKGVAKPDSTGLPNFFEIFQRVDENVTQKELISQGKAVGDHWLSHRGRKVHRSLMLCMHAVAGHENKPLGGGPDTAAEGAGMELLEKMCSFRKHRIHCFADRRRSGSEAWEEESV